MLISVIPAKAGKHRMHNGYHPDGMKILMFYGLSLNRKTENVIASEARQSPVFLIKDKIASSLQSSQ